MYSHADIWRALDRLAVTFGYSPSGLAKKAGLDPTTFNKSKRLSAEGKPRWPSTESIAKVLAVTGMTLTDFFSLTDGAGDAPDTRNAKDGPTIPLLGYAQAGRDGYFDEDGWPKGDGWDQIAFPAPVKAGDDKATYALEVSGNSMEPLYRAGDILVVSPEANIRRGDRVIVKTRKGEIMAKELARKSAARLDLKSLNPAHEMLTLSPKDVAWMARILWISQ